MATLFISPNSIAGKAGGMKKGLYIQSFRTVWFASVVEFLSPLSGYVVRKLRWLGYHL